jgi:ABC-type nitrate/sulfonate/bicarbonate transport system ATPase subunit
MLLGARADATIIDLSNTNKLTRGPAADDFNALEMFDVEASDEALFANLDWIQSNAEQVQIFIDALHSVYQDMHEVPTVTHAIEEAVCVSDQIALLPPRPSRVAEIIRPSGFRQKEADKIRRDPEHLDIVDNIWASLRSYAE